MLKQTTIPIGVDDISEKAQDTWEELVIDTYNNTSRGTGSYSAEAFQFSLLIGDSIPTDRELTQGVSPSHFSSMLMNLKQHDCMSL